MKFDQPKFKLILLTILVFTFVGLKAQIRVTRIAGQDQLSGKSGIVYALPRTVIYTDICVVKSHQVPGPLAQYASDIMGIDEVITKESVSYSLEKISLSSVTEPDPNEVYLIEKEDKQQGEVWISFGKPPVMNLQVFPKGMSPDGFSSWKKDLYMTVEPDKMFRKYADSPNREITDTIIRKVSIDTLVIEQQILRHSREEYSDLEKAQDAADKIRQIEHDKYNLLIGYPETAYSKDALEYMINELEKQRLEYVRLFTGVTVNENLMVTIPVIPDREAESQDYIITGFSKSAGLTEPEGQNQVMLTIKTDDQKLDKDDSGNLSAGLVYLMPKSFQVVINYQGKEMASKRIEVLQFGTKLSLPSTFKKIEFNLEKGTLDSAVME